MKNTSAELKRIVSAGSLQLVRLSKMKVDEQYQGKLSRSHVNKLKNAYDPRLVSVFMVSLRPDGDYYILDGMHRATMLRELGFGEVQVPCQVWENLTYEEEAYLYYHFNENRRKKTAQERLKGGIEAKEQWALDIQQIVHQAGFRLNLETNDLTHGRIMGAGAMDQVQKNYKPGHLLETLKLYAETWGTVTGPRAEMIRGLADFVSIYGLVFSKSRFINCDLRHMHPDTLLQSARALKVQRRGTMSEMITETIVPIYNDRLAQKNRLAPRDVQKERNAEIRRRERKSGK